LSEGAAVRWLPSVDSGSCTRSSSGYGSSLRSASSPGLLSLVTVAIDRRNENGLLSQSIVGNGTDAQSMGIGSGADVTIA
jgi:hypothetical protein